MTTAIVGIDIGSYSCYVSVAKKGGIETILNEYSDRCTASCVNFSNKTRHVGMSANLQLITNPKNTINNFTSLIGKKFSDNNVQIELPYSHYKIFEDKESVGIEVNYLNKVHLFKPEQLVAMLITKLRSLGENDLKIPIKQVVCNVPLFYTDVERRCLVSAMNIAGLECLCLINDLSAVGLLYHSMRSQSFTGSKIVAFVDVGYSYFQSVIIQFTKEKFQILEIGYDANLGGRDFDRVIYKYLSRYFAEQYKIDVLDSTKAGLRLMAECEKIKKRLSANSAEFTVNIECLMNDKDVSAKIDRSLFESQCGNLIRRMTSIIEAMLQQYHKHNKGPISAVEIVGGTTRIPCVKQAISDAFKMEPQNTLNADEAVSRGCAIQCAIMNTNCMIRRVEFFDCIPFGITLDTFAHGQISEIMKYDVEKKALMRQESVMIASSNHMYPFTNAVELSFDECSIIEIRYTDRNEVPNDNKVIGYIKINHEADFTEKMCKMLLEYSIDKFGIFSVTSLVIKRNSKTPRSANQNVFKSEQIQSIDPMKVDPSKKKGKTHKSNPTNYDIYGPIDFQVNYTMSISSNMIEDFRNKEILFIQKDHEETERLNVKNRLEESIYKCRDYLTNINPSFISQNEIDKLLNHINETEFWLFNEGDDEEKERYEDHLQKLENIIKSITSSKTNFNQNESNPSEELNCTLKEAEYVLFHSTTSKPDMNGDLSSNISNLKNSIDACKMILNDSNSGNITNEDTVRFRIAELRNMIDSIREHYNTNME